MITSTKLLNNRNNALGELVTCARNLLGLTQLELSKKIGISQSNLSRIESGKLVPDVYTWYQLSQTLQIPMDSIKTLFMDYKQVTHIRDSLTRSFISIPSHYTQHSCLKIRKLIPYFSYICDHFGWNTLLTWLNQVKIPSFFLSCLDLELNLVFYCDLIRFLIDDLKVSYDSVEAISHYIRIPELHGDSTDQFNSKKSSLDLVKVYIQKSQMYQSFFYYDIIEDTRNSLILEGTLNPLLQNKIHEYDPDGLSFLDEMREEQIKTISLGLLNSSYQFQTPVQIKELSSIYRGDPTTIYCVQDGVH